MNLLLLAEIIGWLRCHRETMNVQYDNYIATLFRYVRQEETINDRRCMNQLRSHLINCTNVPRSAAELRALQHYIDGIEKEVIYRTTLPKAELV